MWMSEAKFRSRVLVMLRPLFAFPVENSAAQGAPDVCCVAGWIELKVAQRPASADQIVSIDLRNTQRIWLRKWKKHGGRAWVLTRVNGDVPVWYLHDGAWAAEHLGLVDERLLERSAVRWWNHEPGTGLLAGALCES